MNNKLYLVTIEISHMEYKTSRILASSKRKAIENYCAELGTEISNYRHYGDTHKVDIINTGKDMYCYVVELK